MEHIDHIRCLRLEVDNLKKQLNEAGESLQSRAGELDSLKEVHVKEVRQLKVTIILFFLVEVH